MKINMQGDEVTAEFHDGPSTLYIDYTDGNEYVLITAERDGGRNHVQLYIKLIELKAALVAFEGSDAG